MDGPPVVTILTAVRTGWQYLSRAVASVRKQTFGNWELLLGPNNIRRDSNAYRAVEAATEGEPRIRIVNCLEARNKPEALNKMVSHAHSQFIAVLDADDLWLPRKLELQIPWMRHFDVVGTRGEYFGDQTGPITVKEGHVTFDDLLECNHILNSSVMLNKAVAVWPDTEGIDDYPMWLELAYQGNLLYNLPDCLVCIRSHADQWFAKRDNAEEVREHYRRKRDA